MALQSITRKGYGQVELNQVSAVRSGRIEAQAALDKDDFSIEVPAENGMILAVDKVSNKVKLYDDSKNYPLALMQSIEKVYNQFADGLKEFALVPSEKPFGMQPKPRLYYLSAGDKFTTNAICADIGTEMGDEFANDTALWAAVEDVGTTPLYGGVSELGYIKVSATPPTDGYVLAVTKKTTMPDRQPAIHFHVIGMAE